MRESIFIPSGLDYGGATVLLPTMVLATEHLYMIEAALGLSEERGEGALIPLVEGLQAKLAQQHQQIATLQELLTWLSTA